MARNPLPFDKLRLFKVNQWIADGESENLSETAHSMIEETDSLDRADIVSSQFRPPTPSYPEHHMLVLDLDVPAALVPSSTTGHSHLFIAAHMTWEQYERVLDALAAAGIVEHGYVGASKARGFTAVRLPWVRKQHRSCRVEHFEIKEA